MVSMYFIKSMFFSWPRIYFLFVIYILGFTIVIMGFKTSIKYRYLIALILLIMLVAGKFTGSSIGYYDNILKGNTESYVESTLLGQPQGIRGDEWATEKPYYFAQIMAKEKLEYFNSKLAFKGADMVVSAFSPVKDIIIVARPDLWGFLFLPKDYAFSFYWVSRLLLLFMASFEMLRILTKKYKYAVIGATCIVFAPPVQWWLSQTLMIMLMAGNYAIVCLNRTIRSSSLKEKLVFTFLMFWFAFIYILTMYPAFQVPLAYIYIGILAILWRDNKEYKILSKNNLIVAFFMSIPFVALLIRFFNMSSPAMNIILQTHYPGNSRPWVNLPWDFELYSIINLFTSTVAHPDFLNASEISQFWNFAVFLIVPILFTKKSIRLQYIPAKILFGISSGLFIISKLPEIYILNKISLLSFTYPSRMTVAFGYGFMLSLILYLSEVDDSGEIQHSNKRITANPISIVLGTSIVAVSIISDNIRLYFQKNFSSAYILIIPCVFFTYMGYLLISEKKENIRKFNVLFILLSLFSTILVNPLTYGTSSMFDKTTMREIRKLDEKDNGRWMVSGSPTISNLVTAQGVARVSGTYYYPDFDMMSVIDKDSKFDDLYNQFAHIDMRLTDEKDISIDIIDRERSEKVNGTNRIVYIPIDVARELGIKYIFTDIEIPEELAKNKEIILIYEDYIDSWKIYKINDEY